MLEAALCQNNWGISGSLPRAHFHCCHLFKLIIFSSVIIWRLSSSPPGSPIICVIRSWTLSLFMTAQFWGWVQVVRNQLTARYRDCIKLRHDWKSHFEFYSWHQKQLRFLHVLGSNFELLQSLLTWLKLEKPQLCSFRKLS